MPLHGEGLLLHVSGAFVREPGIDLIGMWTPSEYRSQLAKHGLLAPSLALKDGVPNDEFRVLSRLQRRLATTLTTGNELELHDLITLARLGEYRLLTSLPHGTGVTGRLIHNRAMLLRGDHSPKRMHEALRKLGEAPGSALEHHMVDVILVAGSCNLGQVDRAASELEQATERLAKLHDRAKWLRQLCALRVRSLVGSLQFVQGEHEFGLNIWLETIEQALETISDDNRVARWCFREFVRRRVERVVRFLVAEGSHSRAIQYAHVAVDIDPHDGRAWRLLGDAYSLTDHGAAAEAYRYAAVLDPTLTEQVLPPAALSIATLGTCSSSALLAACRGLDARPHNRSAAMVVRELAGKEHVPLYEWASQDDQTRREWWFHLFRPILDMGPRSVGPLMTHVPVLAFERWQQLDGRPWRPNVQRAIMPGVRAALTAHPSLRPYDVWSPLELDENLWTECWSTLVTALRRFDKLDLAERVRIAGVLVSLGMQESVLYYLRDWALCPSNPSVVEAELAYVYAFCEYILHIRADRNVFETNRLERIAEFAPRGSRPALTAAQVRGIYAAKTDKDPIAARHWLNVAHCQLQKAQFDSEFEAGIWASRWTRAASFLPFLDGQAVTAIAMLQEALAHGERGQPEDPHEHIVKAENKQTILETIAKTWEHVGRYDKALEVLEGYVANDPYDAGARMEIGEALFALGRFRESAEHYTASAILGPPGDRIGTYMTGEALRANGELRGAALSFIESLECDPMGLSPREALAKLAGDSEVVTFAAIASVFAQSASTPSR
ncbi:hypothetical protein LMG22931_05547 [Paraburkholderia nemoris]|nr:hypothetical protein LMG22931_05547 [Paraburkholderia nemoris]